MTDAFGQQLVHGCLLEVLGLSVVSECFNHLIHGRQYEAFSFCSGRGGTGIKLLKRLIDCIGVETPLVSG